MIGQTRTLIFNVFLSSLLSLIASTAIPQLSRQTYLDIITVDGSPAVSGTGDFSIVMASDVQMFFKICKHEPYSQCIFHNVSTGKKKLLKEAIARQVSCVDILKSTLADIEAVFNNGDITNKALDSELTDIKNNFDTPMKAVGLPFIACLGNHDYGMGSLSDEGRIRLVNYLAEEIIALHSSFTISSIDFERTGEIPDGSGGTTRYTRGSMCFSIEIKNYVFLIMHWAPSINSGGIYTGHYEYTDASSKKDVVDITSSVTWFTTQVNLATAAGKKIIIVPHAMKGLEKYITTAGLESLVETSSIEAVLSGHVHDNWGYYTTLNYGAKDVPVYYAGSASYEKLIVFNVAASNPAPFWKVTPYDTSVAGGCTITADDSDDTM